MESFPDGLSVVVPTFNEEKTIVHLLNKVLKRKEVSEIVVVDDGSTDETLRKIRKLNNKKIRIIKHQKNMGQGSALISGINHAKYNFIIFQDADLELDPNDYPKLIKPLKMGEADFVIGNRWPNHKGYLHAKLGNYITTSLINILFFTNFADSYCGYKISTKKIWQSLNLKSKRFELSPEIASKIALKRIKYKQVVVNYKPRSFEQGKKVKVVDLFRGINKIILLRLGIE